MGDAQSQRTGKRRAAEALWRLLLVLLFAGWWGGLSFYAIVVVPIGTDQIGSVEQGFITQQVTRWHNALLTAMSVCLFIEACRRRRRVLWCVVAGMVLVDAALLFEHSRLTAMLNFEDRSAPGGFYQQHAIYLWITAAEWGLGFVVPFAAGLVSTNGPPDCRERDRAA